MPFGPDNIYGSNHRPHDPRWKMKELRAKRRKLRRERKKRRKSA